MELRAYPKRLERVDGGRRLHFDSVRDVDVGLGFADRVLVGLACCESRVSPLHISGVGFARVWGIGQRPLRNHLLTESEFASSRRRFLLAAPEGIGRIRQ